MGVGPKRALQIWASAMDSLLLSLNVSPEEEPCYTSFPWPRPSTAACPDSEGGKERQNTVLKIRGGLERNPWEILVIAK